MRHFSFCSLLLLAAAAQAGEKARIPLRYEGLNETKLLVLRDVLGHPEMAAPATHTAVLSADGKLGLFVGGGSSDIDGKTDESFLSLWDVAKGHAIKEIRIPGKAVTALALAPDGKSALTALYGNDGKGAETVDLVLWSFETGKARHTFAGPKPKDKERPPLFVTVSFSADGKRALAGATRGGLQLLDLEAGKALGEIRPEKEEGHAVFGLLFPTDNHAVFSWDSDIYFWDVSEKKSLQVFKGHKDVVLNLALSADRKLLASAGLDGTVRLWDTTNGKELALLEKGTTNNPVISLAFTGAGKNVLTVWSGNDPATGQPQRASVILWDGETKKELWTKPASVEGLVPIVIQGKEAILGGGANLFCRWDIEKGVELKTWGGHKTPVTAVAVLPGGRLMSGGQDGALKVWQDGASANHPGHGDAVLALRAGGELLVSTSADQNAKLWNAKSGELLKIFKHEGNVTSAVFGPGGKWIATAGGDRVIRTWDVENGKPIAVLAGHSESINGLAIAPDGDWLATASDDNSVRLWPVKDGRLVKGTDVIVLEGHKRQVTCVAFMPDGKRLLSGSQDKTVRVWNLAKEKTEKVLEGHQNWISSLLVWKDKAVTTADDFRVMIWNLKTGKVEDLIDLTPFGDCPRCLALDQDERNLYVGTSSWVVMRFEELKR